MNLNKIKHLYPESNFGLLSVKNITPSGVSRTPVIRSTAEGNNRYTTEGYDFTIILIIREIVARGKRV